VSDQSDAIRVTDADRERAVGRLGDATVAGSLTLEELAERVDIAHAARTQGELELVTADVPASAPMQGAPIARRRHRVIASRLTLGGRWSLPGEPSFLCVAGTLEIDLRQAAATGPVVDLTMVNWFGTVTVVVPEGTAVELSPGGFSSTHDITVSGQPKPGAPSLRLRTGGGFGTTRVTSKPRRHWLPE
jgi:hypothetical protein